MTPTQCRAARALLDWSQQQLADASGIGIVTVRQLENGAGAPRNATTETLMNTFERAGVEFLIGNGKGEGVQLAEPSFSLDEFLAFVRLYNQNLQKKARHNGATGLPEFGFAFVYKDRNAVELMYRGKRLGSARWSNKRITFDPPLAKGDVPSLSDNTFDRWLAQAELREATGG